MKLAEYLFLNKVSDKGHSWNFGPKYNSFISVYELLAKIKKLKKLKILFKKNKFVETKTLKLDSKKAMKIS